MAGKEWSSGLWVELGLTTLQKKKKKSACSVDGNVPSVSIKGEEFPA